MFQRSISYSFKVTYYISRLDRQRGNGEVIPVHLPTYAGEIKTIVEVSTFNVAHGIITFNVNVTLINSLILTCLT